MEIKQMIMYGLIKQVFIIIGSFQFYWNNFIEII